MLGLIQPEIAPFDSPTPKTLTRTKHEMKWIKWIWPFEIQEGAFRPHLGKREVEGVIDGTKERWWFSIRSQ